jgi:predicted nucleic acid-binding protein
MAVKGPVFLDTSALLAGLIEMGDASLAADRILDVIANGGIRTPLTAWHCCLEFYSVATRLPAGLRLEPDVARQLVADEILGRFRVCALPAEAYRGFLDAVATERVAGGRLYDAHIAEIARLASATVVVTDNRRHFASLLRHGVRVQTAAEFATALDS